MSTNVYAKFRCAALHIKPKGFIDSDGHQLTKKVATKSLTNFFSYTNSLTTFSSTSSLNSLTAFQLVTN